MNNNEIVIRNVACMDTDYVYTEQQVSYNGGADFAANPDRNAQEHGGRNFKELTRTHPDLHKAISSFAYSPTEHDYCGDCADALKSHLQKHGFMDLEVHNHGHSFVGHNTHVIDTWNGHPRVWYKNDPVLRGTVYATRGHARSHYAHGHSCWCGEPGFEKENIGE